jgi:hypothetical protein
MRFHTALRARLTNPLEQRVWGTLRRVLSVGEAYELR